jgi:hypothetical protein
MSRPLLVLLPLPSDDGLLPHIDSPLQLHTRNIKLWLFDDPLWQTGAHRMSKFLSEETLPRHFKFFPKLLSELTSGAQKFPQILPDLEESSQLSRLHATFIPKHFDAYKPDPCECTHPQGQPMKFRFPRQSQHPRSSATAPIVFSFFFLFFPFFSCTKTRPAELEVSRKLRDS